MELKEIINGMIAGTGRPMSAEDIYKSMTDNGGEIQIEEIKLALKELSRDGRVIITRRGKAALPEQLGLIYTAAYRATAAASASLYLQTAAETCSSPRRI